MSGVTTGRSAKFLCPIFDFWLTPAVLPVTMATHIGSKSCGISDHFGDNPRMRKQTSWRIAGSGDEKVVFPDMFQMPCLPLNMERKRIWKRKKKKAGAKPAHGADVKDEKC